MTDTAPPIGLVAGRGALPIEVVKEARRRGRQVVCVDMFQGGPRLEEVVDAYYPLTLGDLGGLINAFRRHGVREVLLAGKVDKLPSIRRAHLDAVGMQMVPRTPDLRDTTILNAFMAIMQQAGFEIGGQARYLSHLVPEAGTLSERAPSEPEWSDIQTGLRIAAQIAALDIGQAIAIQRGAVVAVEAAEGTDDMIRRAGALSAGIVVVKVSRPHQDPRYDLPVVGPETVQALAAANGTALAIEAGRTLLVERAEVVRAAAVAGIALVAAAVPPATT